VNQGIDCNCKVVLFEEALIAESFLLELQLLVHARAQALFADYIFAIMGSNKCCTRLQS